MAGRASDFLSDTERDKLLDRYDRDQERLSNYHAGKGGFDDVGSATADRQAQALENHYDGSGYGGHDWYDKLRRERDEDRGEDKDYSGAKDYSSPSDQKAKNVADSLKNGEQGKNETKIPGHDIGQQERGPWNNSAGSALSDATKNAGSQKQGNFFSRHKKGLIGWIVGIAMGGGMFGATTILSGPAQWIQVMNFIKDMTSWVNGAQTGARYLHNMRTLAKWEDNISDTIQNSRLGIVGKKVANTAIKRMEEQGMSFNKRLSGNAGSITIDTTKEYGNLFNQDAKGGSVSDAVKNKRLDTLSSKYGIDRSKLNLDSLSSDGKLTINFDKMSYTEARKFINATNNVSKINLMGQIQTRLALKKVGKISWLHPIKKLEAKVANKFADWVKARMEKIAKNGFSSADDAAAKAAQNAKDLGKSEDEIKKAAETARKGWTQSVKEAAEEITDKVVKFAVEKVGGKVSTSAVKAAIPVVGWVTLAIQAYCMVVNMDDGIGAEKYQNTVTVAEGDTAETLGLGSQVMTGHGQDQDLDMDQLGQATKLKLYNSDVEEISPTSSEDGKTNEGYKTIGTTSSSWWSAAPVQAALGQQPSTSSLNDVPAALNDVTNAGLSFGGSKDLQNIWNIFSNTLEFAGGGIVGATMKALGSEYTPMDAVCWVFDQIDAVIGGILSWILTNTGLMSLLTNLPFMDALANLMNNIMGWLRGAPLNIGTATPQQFGSINMYGGVFTSNEQMLAVGGRALTESEQTALELEQKQYLAEQQAQKPLLARLFDPTDYNSTIAQIGRAADIDTSNQSIGTQLKNVGKIFASVPKLFSFALGKIGGTASAASAISYDYNVPMIAFSQTEMDTIAGDNSDSSYDLIPNTKKVFNMIDSGQITSEKTKQCWGVEISGAPSYTITQADNSAGAAWNYGDNYSGDKMKDNGCEGGDMLAFRTYMMDYATLVSADCYENDGWAGGDSADSCAEMGFMGSSSSAGETSVVTVDGMAFPLGNVSKSDVPENALSYGHTADVPGYLAVDIMVSEGTPVLSMTEGEVVRVKDGSDLYGATSIQVRTGEYIYYYTHLAAGAEVKVGDKVTAGQRIGKVGTAAQGGGSEHLHLDASKWPDGDTRGACSRDGGCFDVSKFLDILPSLKKLQAALPDN